jgi:hypothetical protein
MEDVRIRHELPRSPRCPFCLEDVGDLEQPSPARKTCDGCGTHYHSECAIELDHCATLGCHNAFRGSFTGTAQFSEESRRRRVAPPPAERPRVGVQGQMTIVIVSIILCLGLALASPLGVDDAFKVGFYGGALLGGILILLLTSTGRGRRARELRQQIRRVPPPGGGSPGEPTPPAEGDEG